jgi:PAS domain S-box-containing protein
MTDDPSGPDLAAEVEHLRARLAEAEEVLRAIRNGEVDGVLITGGRGEQVYTLRGADRIYRQLIETMSEGAVTVSADGVILYCNVRLAEMLGQPLDRVMGTALRNYLPPADQQALDAILAQARTEPSRREINLKSSEGRLVPVYLSASRLPGEGAEVVFCLVLTDLTEQKHHEQVVAEERLARLILEQSAEAIVVCDEQGRVMRASQTAERLCDGSPLRRPFAEVFPLQTDASVPFHLAPVLQGETLRNVDVALDGHGQAFDLVLNAGPLLSGKEILGCVVTLTDITERKHATEALVQRTIDLGERVKERDCLYGISRLFAESDKSVAEVFAEAVHRIPPGWYYPEIACARITFEEHEFITDNFRETPWKLSADIVISGKTVGTVEVCYLEERPVLDEGPFLKEERDLLGDLARQLGTIAERRRADVALRESEARYRAVAQSANLAIVTADSAGNIVDWNPHAETMFGHTAAEVLGQPLTLLMPERRRELHLAGMRRLQSGGGSHIIGRSVEMEGRRKDSTEFPLELSLAKWKIGESWFVTGMMADITEQKRLEAQFLQAQKMESVGQLASGIAHDFNNLLTVINGTSELLLAQVRPDDPVHADVQEIHRAGERAATLTRQLLAFSRQQILEPRVMSLNTVVAGTESLLRRVLGEDIDLVIVPAPDLGHVKADPGQIEQVMTNLAVNARDAMPQGGQLTIETQNVTITEDDGRRHGVAMVPGSYVRLAVRDSGVGMDEATRARIFEPFFTTKGPGKGTGLGLSTVYGIVKQSHGFVWVESEVGQGTSFKIYLPRVTEAAGTDRPAPTVMSRSGTETILLVEDNAGLRTLATRLLAPAGYTVLGAASGEAALLVLERHEAPVHLLLSDVVLPGMSGRHLAEQLAQTHPEMKVLYMSGYTSDTIVRHGVLDAQVPFLNKPFTAAALLRKVREVLDS